MAAIKIRPISDLRNDYASVEADVREGPVFLTKNGYGMLVTMTIEEYERLLDPLERLLDETDEYCRTHLKREDGEEMFKKIRDRRGELPPSVQEIVGILPADIDVEKVYREHLEEKYR